ncbi:LysE family translocator [Povalibacter sp.]|uniref:LysE family translocator n=1 Tax=Povalibacter sp. TaxID=1962978 RepID=UPI002F42516C
MHFWQGFAVITVVHLLAAASPGPDFAFVTRQSLVYGRRAGLFASIGIALGLAIHIVYSAAGLAAVIAHSVQLMMILKVGGGCYLIYLGVRSLLSKAGPVTAPEAESVSDRPWRLIAGGFLCNAFNPKAPIYFLALFTIVLSPDLPTGWLMIYGVWLMILQWLWFTLVATVFTHRLVRDRLMSLRHWIDRTFGLAMVLLGLRVLTADHD